MSLFSGYFTHEGLVSLARFFAYVGTIYLTAVLMRGREQRAMCINPLYSDGFPIHIDTISIMGLPIVYFKGSLVEFSKLR